MFIATSPLLQNLLMEDPLPLGLVLLVVAGVLVFLAFQRANKKLLRFAGLAVILAVVVFLVAAMITTTRERIMSDTERLVSYTAPLDIAAFKLLVSPRVTVVVGDDSNSPTFAGPEVFDRLEKAVQNYPISNQSVIAIDAEIRTAESAISQFDVRSDSRGGRVMTRWLLTWQKQADDNWQVVNVQWLDCPGLIGLKPSAQWLR